jgi:hypothetical protein
MVVLRDFHFENIESREISVFNNSDSIGLLLGTLRVLQHQN